MYTTDDPRVERLAKALYESIAVSMKGEANWDAEDNRAQIEMLETAHSILNNLETQGYKLVPIR